MTLPELAIRRPVTVSVLLLSMLVIGAIALTRLPLAFMPDNEEREIFVIVDYPNASPKAVERMIVRPLEEGLSAISGLERMWSSCDSDGGRINLNFDWTVNLDLKRAEVRERLDAIRDELPDDVERIAISSHWRARESGETIMEGRLSSGRDLSKDYNLLERKIIKPLERVSGVASVILDGVNPREVKINLKLDALRRHNVDASFVSAVLANNNLDRSLGEVVDEGRRFTMRAVGSFQNLEEVENLPLGDTGLKLSDVAEVTYREPPLEYGRHLEGKFAVGVSVVKESSANTVEVCNQVREKVAAMGADPELAGIQFLVWEDQGREIENTIADLQQTGLFGAMLAGVVLFLFLRRGSTTVVALICIPFSLIVACGVVWAQGKTLNTLTLLGLIVGIGMLVDNAVVIMENIYRYQQKGYDNRVAALLGAREVSIAVIAATATSIIVFLPLIFSKPTEWNLILQELSLTVCFTLIASLFVSQTLIPLAMGRFLRQKKPRPDGALMNWMKSRAAGVWRVTLRQGWIAPVVGAAVIGAAYFSFDRIAFNFGDTETEMFVQIRYNFSEDLPLERKQEVVTQVEQSLFPHKERLNVDSIYSWWSDRASLTRLYMKDGYTTEDAMNDVRRELPALIPKIAGVSVEAVDNAPFWRRNRGKRVGFQLLGPDTEVLGELAEQAKLRLEGIPGLFDFNTTAEGGTTELHARIDRERAREYNVNLNRPADVVSLTFRGRRLPQFKGPDGEVEMRLTLDEQEVESVDQLKSLPMLRTEGRTVALDSFAEFAEVRGPENIRRNEKATSVFVGARFEEGKREDYVDAARERLQSMELPYGYRWDFQSFRREEEESIAEFLINVLLALGLVYAVMAGLFESARQGVALIAPIVFSTAGAFWTFHITGLDFDRPASVGLLLLWGVVVNNGIVMIEHINKYRREGMARFDAMILGSKERLRPIMMTTITTLVGLVPMAVQQPSLGGVYYYSMAFVIMGGLVVSAILTTVLLPSIICSTEDFFGWIARQFGFKPADQVALARETAVAKA